MPAPFWQMIRVFAYSPSLQSLLPELKEPLIINESQSEIAKPRLIDCSGRKILHGVRPPDLCLHKVTTPIHFLSADFDGSLGFRKHFPASCSLSPTFP